MPHRISNILMPCVLLMAILPLGTLRGQAEAGRIRFSCSGWDRIKGSPLHYLASPRKEKESMESVTKRLVKVDVPEMSRSLIYEYEGGRTISFYRKKTLENNATGLETFASVTIPPDWERVLLLFFPGDKEGEYRIYPLRDDRKHAPYGSYQFVNLTNQPLQGFIENKQLSLKPGGRTIIKFTGDESRSLDFGIWTTVENKSKWLERNTLTYRPSKYLIYFFHSETDRMGRMKIESRGIVEFRPPPIQDTPATVGGNGG